MSYQDDANAIVNLMYRACSTDEQRERLDALLASHPANVTNIKQQFGLKNPGLYFPSSNTIYLSHKLRYAAPAEALSVYLHELVHAGALGPALFNHDARFCAEVERVYDLFDITLSEKGRRYCTRDMPQRKSARQPAVLSIVGIAVPLAAAVYLQIEGFPLATSAFFVCCALAVGALEKARINAA